MAYRTSDIREAQRWLRWRYALGKHPFEAMWKWANQKDKIFRFRMIQKWAGIRQEKARSDKAREKFKNLRWRAEEKVDALLAQRSQASTNLNTSPGSPHWGGAAEIIEREVVPVFTRRGVPISSRKRTSTLGNPSSDHFVGNVYAYAVDAGTYSGADDAHAVAAALGIDESYSTGNYTSYYIRRDGHTYRIQILWAVSGHYNHVHVGCRLVS